MPYWSKNQNYDNYMTNKMFKWPYWHSGKDYRVAMLCNQKCDWNNGAKIKKNTWEVLKWAKMI